MPERLTALIIGCGDIAGGYDQASGASGAVLSHAGAYRAHGGVDIVACVEPDPDRRAAFMDTWGIETAFADLQDCAASGMRFDIASLCNPSAAHETALSTLLEMPVRAVFAEKPLTGSPERSRPIVKRYADQKRPLAVNYLRRWAPGIVELKSEIASGAWGQVRGATGRYTKGLFNCGSHMIDLLHYLVGPVTACGVFSRIVDFADADPTLSARLKFENQAPVIMFGSDNRDYFTFELTMMMEYGEIVIEDLGLGIRRRKADHHTLFVSQKAPTMGTNQASGFDRAMVVAVSNVVEHLGKGTPLVSDGWSALAAEETCAVIMDLASDRKVGMDQGAGL